jgi:hypothetical protein
VLPRADAAGNASVNAIADPRVFPDPALAPLPGREICSIALASLAAATGNDARLLELDLQRALRRSVESGDDLADLIASAPSVDVARQVWRHLDELFGTSDSDAGLAARIFAIPLVIVAGKEGDGADRVVPGTLRDPGKLTGILREHDALRGNRNFALADSLVQADEIDVARLRELLAWQRLPDAANGDADTRLRALNPAPIPVTAGRESVHLRFLVGTALARPGAELFGDARVGAWGTPFTQELGRTLGEDGVAVLALPRAPQRPLPAVAAGRAAQREVSAQLFASNAIRRIRGAVGEPVAVISAHRAADVAGGGELRLSLSSVFEPRDAEGFRCPLWPIDRAADVAQMLIELLRDCRVTDVRVLSGVHPDRDAATGLPLLFKPETIPRGAALPH